MWAGTELIVEHPHHQQGQQSAAEREEACRPAGDEKDEQRLEQVEIERLPRPMKNSAYITTIFARPSFMPGARPGMTSVPSMKERAIASANSRPESAISCVFFGSWFRFAIGSPPLLHRSFFAAGGLLVLLLLFHSGFPCGEKLVLMEAQVAELVALFPQKLGVVVDFRRVYPFSSSTSRRRRLPSRPRRL